MPKFGPASIKRLSECHPDLQALFYSVISEVDCSILCGYRGQKEQQEAYMTGHSKAQWKESPHNFSPSYAVDVAPFPIDWANEKRFNEFAAIVKWHAERLKIKIKWGGDFKSFKDRPHWELLNWETKVI